MTRTPKASPFLLVLSSLILLFLLPTSFSQQQGPTRYVNNTDPTCQGKSPCYTTIQAAVNAALPGDTIQIQAGTYAEHISISGKNNSLTATESNRIIIEADPLFAPGSVVVTGTGQQCTDGEAIQVKRSRFITIRDLTIAGANAQAISLVGGGINQNQAIHIERNRIFGNGSSECDGGITIIQENLDTLIVNNLIYSNGRNGISVINTKGSPQYIVNNTIHANQWNGINLVQSQEVFLANNIITQNGTAEDSNGGRFGIERNKSSKSQPQEIHLLNNLICGNRLGEIDGPILDTEDSGNFTPQGAEGPGVSASPGCQIPSNVYANLSGFDGLSNTVDDDFGLASHSPAIDRGMDSRTLGLSILFNPIFEADFLTEAIRPSDGNADRAMTFDIGAFEFPNAPPIADTGPDHTTFRGVLVILSGSASHDPEGAPLTFQWTTVSQPSGSAISLSNPTSATQQFTPLILGSYVFHLVVNDGQFNSAPDSVQVTVVNRSPTANANGPYSDRVGVPIQFSGSGTDPDGDALTFTWDFGDGGIASGAAATHAYATSGTFTVTLTVADPFGGIATSQTIATVTPAGPEIIAVSPGSGTVGTEVTIQGGGFDPSPGKTIVKFNGVQALITSVTETTIKTFVPLGATTGRITVETSKGIATGAEDFVVLLRQDFALSVSPEIGTAVPGTSASYGVRVSSIGLEPFTGLATLSVSGLPGGVTASLTPQFFLSANATGLLTLATTTSTPTGSYPINMQATSQIEGRSITRTAQVTLAVQLPGQTVLIGQVRDENDRPLAGVSIKQGGSAITPRGVTDPGGNFFIPLSIAGPQVFLIDGSTANTPSINYSTVPVTIEIQAGVVNTLGFTPKLHAQPVAKLIPIIPAQETVLAPPDVPGFKMEIPAGVQIVGWDGQVNTQVSVTAVPIDRSPLPPLPPGLGSRQVYLFNFGKMGGGLPNGNIPIDTANDVDGLPGEQIDLYYFNEAPDGTAPNRWEKYGTGTVSSDGTRIITDIGPKGIPYGIPRFCCGARVNVPPPQVRAGGGPSGGQSGSGQTAGEPVDTATGFFYLDKTDMVLPGILPTAVTRTYRTNLTNSGPFGLGTSWPYDIFLQPPPNGSADSLILFTPGNRQDLFARQLDGSFINTTSPPLRGAVVTVAGGVRSLRFKDGSLWHFDGAGRLISQADRNGNVITLARDVQGRVIQIIEPSGRQLTIFYTGTNLRVDRIQDPIGRAVLYGYDGSARLTSVTDPAGGITRYTYDGSHRMVSITDPRGITFLTNVYDGAGRVIQQTQADGGVWTFAYAASGAFISQTTVTDPRENSTTYRFNSSGFLISQTDVLGQVTTFERQAGTNLVFSTTDPLGRVVRFTYDAGGNVTSITDPAGNVRRFEYEPIFNKLTKITDPLGQVTLFEYDNKGNLTATVDPIGARTTIAYNSFGQPVSTTDPLGNTATFSYDPLGNLATIADPLGNKTQRAYDLVSRLIEQTDPRGRSTRFSYDGLNRITQIVDALNGMTAFTYDGNGNLLTVTDARGNTITHSYDVMDHLSTRTDPLGRQETYEYDQSGNLIHSIDRKQQVTTLTYDALDRRVHTSYGDGTTTRLVFDAGGRLIEATDSAGGTILNSYDLLDRLTSQSTGMGTVSYHYDSLGRRISMAVPGQALVAYGYDINSQLTQVLQGSQFVNLGYDALGRRTHLTLPNGVSTEYVYDPASRLTELIYRDALGTLGNLTYQYDSAGNRVAVGGSFARTLLPDPIASAIYDATNQQLAFGDKTMTFDANGNLTSLSDSNGITSFTWDARNQMTSMARPNLSASFGYDVLGRRTLRTVNGLSHAFQYDGRNVVSESAADGAAFYLGGLGLDDAWIRRKQDKTDFIIADALGSSLGNLDALGTVTNELTYEPFGRSTRSGAISDNPLSFTGREDDGTGLLHYRARYYHPGLARYISEDPLRFRDGINAYTYVRNSPINARDPLGLLTIIVHGLRFGKPKEGSYTESKFATDIKEATGETIKEVLWSGNVLSGEGASDAFFQIAQLISNAPPGEPINIIGHSWGSVLAANYLAATGNPVDLLVTMGSPLSAFTADPASASVWVNISSVADPISWGSLTSGAERLIRVGLVDHTGYWNDPVTKKDIIKRIKQKKKRRK